MSSNNHNQKEDKLTLSMYEIRHNAMLLCHI